MSLNDYRRAELLAERREQLRRDNTMREAQSLLATCEAEITRPRELAIQQLAATGLQEAQKAFQQAAGLISADPDEGLKAVRSAQQRLHETVANAEAKAGRWSAEQAAAQARIAEVSTRLAAKRQADNTAGVQLLDQAAVLLEQARSLRVRAKKSNITTILDEADAFIQEASKAQFDESVRREIVSSLLQTLQKRGFAVEKPSLMEGEQGGTVHLVGRLPSGKSARFEVQIDGRMHYDLDGYEGRACAKEVEQIEELLKEQFAVKLGPRQTVWKNPDRISKGARNIPGGTNIHHSR